MMKAAALLSWASGLGFGLPGVYAIWHFVINGSVGMVFGFPAYGMGTFEKVGVTTSVPLLILFLLVCIAECVAGWLMWGSRRSGAILALAILPLEVVFWIGCSLPFGPPLALVRTILILASRSSWKGVRSQA
jgi:hypothetical protein